MKVLKNITHNNDYVLELADVNGVHYFRLRSVNGFMDLKDTDIHRLEKEASRRSITAGELVKLAIRDKLV